MSQELCLASAVELSDGFQSGRLSPVEATQAVLDQIERHNGNVNAIVFLDGEGALDAARASEQRWHKGEPLGPIDGIPSTVKELLLAKGWPTRRCSQATPATGDWTEDAPAVARLREQGAVLLGKTNSPEYGWKGTTDNLLFGTTYNPWDLSKTPGGSSGGASAAAAAGMGNLHIGTDGGGSIRIPASFTGIFGLKPTYGRVPVYPVSTYGTISHAGPMTRTVEEAALMLNTLSQPDGRDGFALPPDGTDYLATLQKGIKGLKIAYSPTLGFIDVDPEVAALVEKAARSFEDLGAHVEQVDQVMEDPTETFCKIWYSGAALAASLLPSGSRSKMDPGLVSVIEIGESLDHMDYVDAVYRWGLLGEHMHKFHQNYDLLLTPTEPLTAFDVTLQTPLDNQSNWVSWTPFTYPFNLTRQPAASITCGLSSDGLPVGLQIVGRLYEDELVLRAARAYEETRPWQAPPLLKKVD